MNYFKRILIIALCSILCVCTVPRFSLRSEAASTSTYALYETLLTLSGYLASKGYSTFHDLDLSIPSVRELKDWTQQEQEDLLFDFAAELNSYGTSVGAPGLGDEILRAFRLATISGFLTLTQSARINFDNWIYGNTVSGSVSVGDITVDISSFYNEPEFVYVAQASTYTRTISLSCESISFYGFREGEGTSSLFMILPTDVNNFVWSIDSNAYVLPYIINTSTQYYYQERVSYNNRQYIIPYIWSFNNPPANTTSYIYRFNHYSAATYIADVMNKFYGGEFTESVTGSIGTTQITDTSETDLLTSTNTIASDGTVEGDTTIYLPDTATLEDAIDSYNNQSITLDEFLKILGINSVESDATVQEKEDALTVVVTPSDDYLWFTKTQWGADAIEETRKASASTRAEEDSLADSIANTANGGSDPEDPDNKSRGKGLLALLLLGLGIWNTPIIAGDGTPSGGGTDDGSGDDGSGDTSGYLAESIAGMAVAGSLVDDLFDSAGGSDGYGLIYTVGASFVIFSVIIGAANYFGALFHGSDTKQNIKASGKRSTPGKEKKGG